MRALPLILSSIVGAVLLAPVSLSAKPKNQTTPSYSVLRQDLTQALHKLICVDRVEPTTKELWKSGVYDANLVGYLLTGSDGLSFAKAKAAGNSHRGYAGGRCEDGRAFAASVPAAAPISLKGDSICLPAELSNHCRAISVDFAAAKGGRSKKLLVDLRCASKKNLPRGLVSVTCLPIMPRWVGPVGIAYVPVQGGPDSKVPEGAILNVNADVDVASGRSEGNLTRSLGDWVNSIRKQEGLPPLFFGDLNLLKATDRLAIGSSLTHDRNSIAAEKSELKKRGILFLGEDRVKGKTLEQVAWQLFYSARHRDLLLSRDATHGAVVVKSSENHGLDNQIFAIIVLGRGPT